MNYESPSKKVGPLVENQEESDILRMTENILKETNSIEVRPEDRNERGELLASPEGNVSNLSELEWKMVRTKTFKQWFEKSLVVDENGEPMVVYHGSREKFKKFDLNKTGNSKDSGFLGKGLYFTPQKELAENYGPVLYKTFLKINNLQTFTEDHGNVRFDDKPLPENIHEEVFRRYEPLKQKEHERLKKQDEENRGSWTYMSSWNGEDKFENILSSLVREVLIEQGFDGVFGYNQFSKIYEYAVFNENDIMIIPQG